MVFTRMIRRSRLRYVWRMMKGDENESTFCSSLNKSHYRLEICICIQFFISRVTNIAVGIIKVTDHALLYMDSKM